MLGRCLRCENTCPLREVGLLKHDLHYDARSFKLNTIWNCKGELWAICEKLE